MYILIVLLLVNSFGFCDTIENGWKGIKPLKTNKVSVNKLLGTPEIDDNGYQNYSTDDAFVHMNYSIAPCKNDEIGRGEFSVPKDTVLDYTVNIDKVIKLSEIKFNRERYIVETDEHMKGSVHYINDDDGVMISTHTQDGIEYVGQIRFRASKQDAGTFKCKN